MTDFIDFELVCEQLPLGVFVLDKEYAVRYWNGWLAHKTGIAAEQALGQTLERLFDDWENDRSAGDARRGDARDSVRQRFYWAVEQAIAYKIPQLLSQALNRFLLPVPVALSGRHGVSLMQQQVKVVPLTGTGGETYAVVIVQDVTENVIRTSAMRDMVQRFKEVSLRDPLTDLFNRRFMWEWLEQHIKEAQRYQEGIACLMIDIDRFKKLNDNHGHQFGDEILKEFALTVSEVLRESDIFVRYGGEEFAAFLPKCDGQQAIATAERIVETVRHASIAGLESRQVTCSVGVAVYDPACPASMEDLLQEADQRLYDAKRSGRDRVMPRELAAASADVPGQENEKTI
jgi:diguanylate cyclase (GGDEF)-like protein